MGTTYRWVARRLALAVLLVGAALAFAVPAASAQACAFQLGFAALHDLIPDVVGDCVEDEHHDPTTGDALQQTTGGLLVWRKSDNWTAFTDGAVTWVNGPLGLQQRSNDQRFWWEANPDGLAVVPPPRPGDRCHTAGLTLSLDGVDAGAGNRVGTFRLTNVLDVSCTFDGYPGAELRDSAGNPLPTNVDWGGGWMSSEPPPAPLLVPPGDSAIFLVHWEVIPVGNETTCPLAMQLAVTPPDEYVPLLLSTQIQACGGGHLDVGPIRT